MGGINCNQPPPTEEVSEELRREYTRHLASYTGDLCRTVAAFFAANAAIEDSVSSGGSWQEEAIAELQGSANHSRQAQLKLGTVASLHAQLGSGGSQREQGPDFFAQQDRLSRISSQVESACHLLGNVRQADGYQLQTLLWDDEDIPESLTTTLALLSECIDWQSGFAVAKSPSVVRS